MKSKFLSAIMVITLLFTLTFTAAPAWAANEISVKQTSGTVSMEGISRTKVSVEVTNETESKLTGVVATINSSALTYEPYTNKIVELGAIDGKKSAVATWEMNTTGLELGKTYKLPITVTSNEGYTQTIDAVIYIFIDTGTTPGEKTSKAVLSVNPTSGGLSAGSNSSLTVTVNNTGNTILNDVIVNLSSLPEGVTLHNTNAFLSLGSIQSGKTKSINIPISINSNVVSGNYPFGVTVKATDSANAAVNFTQTNYIEVSGDSSGNPSFSITTLSLPEKAKPGEEFNISFSVKNDSTTKANSTKITVKGGEGLINKTKNIFSETNFDGGAVKNYSVTFFSLDTVENKNVPIEIIIEQKNGTETNSISQFEGIFISTTGGSSSVKTPQLIVNTYNYGGNNVHASEDFTLSFTLYNTSTEKPIKNVKVSMSSDDGTFIPVGSSNTMYIPNIGTGKTSTQSIKLRCKPDAVQKTIPVHLDMTYEDNKGNEYSAKETISIPVVQKTKLKIDEPSLPYEVYPGQQASLSINFYNIGKTTLTNLTVSAEGNFDTPNSQNYFVGNLEAGKQDSYDLTFIPKDVGTLEGIVLFTFEDAAGDQTIIEKPFSMNVIEVPVSPEEDIVPTEETNGLPMWQSIAIGVAGLLAIIIVLVILRKKKKKKEQELTIDEE